MTLITGGIKSGKSRYALKLAEKYKKPRIFLATAEVIDAEMGQRVEQHQIERGDKYMLYEEPIDIFNVFSMEQANIYIIDCITLWVSNLLHYKKDVENYFKKLIDAIPENTIVVTNEVGLGIVPDNSISRKYVDYLGKINKILAKKSEVVYLMVCGIPNKIK